MIEARDRIGGRTYTKSMDSGHVDHGAAWIHGNIDNPVAAVCDAYGIPYSPHPFRPVSIYVAQEGRALSAREVEDLMPDLEQLASHLEPTESVDETFDKFIRGLDLSATDRPIARFLSDMLVSSTAAPIDRLSIWPVAGKTGKLFEGDNWVIDNGYSALTDRLAEGIDIRLRSVVEQVTWSEVEVQVVTSAETIMGSHAIVTIPLGILKAETVKFDPPLPPERVEALSRLEMGHFEKVVLTFKEKFWHDFSDLAPFNDNLMIYMAEPGEEGAFPEFFDLTTFARTPMIVCLYSGSFAKRAQETMSDDELIQGTLKALGAVFGRELPPHSEAAVTRWHSDQYALGSYSYFPVGATPGDMNLLGEPLGDRLLFAGEHTIAEYNATVHGAMLSGLREAQRIDTSAQLPGVHQPTS